MSAQPQRLIAALDLGSTKIVALIAEVTGDARDAGARILGVGVERSAGRQDILEAHRTLIATVHPDRGGSNELVHEANAARDVLLADLPAPVRD